MYAWCHGEPGIGLLRTRLARYLQAPQITTDIGAAARATIRHGFGGNYSVCQGDLENLLSLLAMRPLADRRGVVARNRGSEGECPPRPTAARLALRRAHGR